MKWADENITKIEKKAENIIMPLEKPIPKAI